MKEKGKQLVANLNFGLTKAEFDQLTSGNNSVDPRIMKVIYETQKLKNCQYLMLKMSATKNDAYDAFMEAYSNFIVLLKEGKLYYGNLNYLLTKMTIQEFLDNKYIRKKWSDLKYYYQNQNNLQQASIEKVVYTAFTMMPKEDKQLLHAIYFERDPMHILAGRLQVNDFTVRKRKQRAIGRLRIFFNTIFKRDY